MVSQTARFNWSLLLIRMPRSSCVSSYAAAISQLTAMTEKDQTICPPDYRPHPRF